ncbi:uncharacterized protein EMH_0020930 [Eimeria mitis]|uniref:Uncharacterized protein n=1 Tax=Eimeria mitis TaxID=44415 RepID=U6K945_9EIME|nr:uncharacterized protein EMH_0020930 [Eimeria mitis]CDJ34550.1 hypothetical protein EMH_0020930 [Eimeria mitis]
MLLVETFTEEKNIFWCKKYSDASKTQPLPEKTASKEEREDFAVRNMLLVTVFEAAETRLEFLNRIEELSKKHQIESVFSLEVERPLPQPTVEDGRDAFSFESFTRRLEKLGVQGVAQEGDSQGTVPWLVAQDLSNAVAIKAHYDASNMAVVDLYEDFLTFIEQTKVGKTEAERKRIENVILPESDVSVPLSVLADVVRSVKTTYEMEHFPAPQILSWRDQWNVPKLSSLTNDIRLSQKTMFDVALDSKHSALENWGHLEDIDSLATNILPSAVFLL